MLVRSDTQGSMARKAEAVILERKNEIQDGLAESSPATSSSG